MDMARVDAFVQNPLIGREVHRMNGAGNAILVLDLRGAEFLPTPGDARALARAPGLGYDQMMVLGDASERGQAAFMTIFNQDGSLSASCGNGTRCVAHYLAEQTGATELRLATAAGRLAVSRVGALAYTVDMGRPRLDWQRHSAGARSGHGGGGARPFRPAAGVLRQHGQSARDPVRARTSTPSIWRSSDPTLEHDPHVSRNAPISRSPSRLPPTTSA